MKLSLRDTRVVAPCCNIAVLCCRAAPLSCSAAAFCCWSDRISFSAAFTAGSSAIGAGAAACGNRSPKLSNFGKALAKYAAAAAPPTTKADKEATTISLVLYRLGARGSSSSCVSVFGVSACDLCALSATVLSPSTKQRKKSGLLLCDRRSGPPTSTGRTIEGLTGSRLRRVFPVQNHNVRSRLRILLVVEVLKLPIGPR